MRFFAVVAVSTLLLTTSTALAQDRDNIIIVDCSQVQQVFVSQGQYGSAGAVGDGAVAGIAQELNISQNQVNACLGNPEGTTEETNTEETTDGTTEETTGETTEETTVVRGETVIVPKKVAADRLPETGGANLMGIVLASGCALLGVGLILGRLAR